MLAVNILTRKLKFVVQMQFGSDVFTDFPVLLHFNFLFTSPFFLSFALPSFLPYFNLICINKIINKYDK